MNSKKWMLLAVLSFCILAISVKEISSSISSFEIIFFRSLIGLLILILFFYRSFPKTSFKTIKKHLFRNVFHLLGQYGWIVGITYLSLSEVTAIEFTVPIWVIIIAAIFLDERITKIKIISIVLGFIGVLIILKPGIELITLNSIIVLASAISYAITHVFTKKIVKSSSALEVVIIMCLIQMPISFFIALPEWHFPLRSDYFWLSLVGISALVAHFSLAKAFQKNNISDLIVIDYLRLPILVLVGILFYNEEFSYALVLGGTLIISGNYLNNKRT
ncbi:MAG: DMT family transporter [Crocinitomicaceae bacterium]|nr:DMT family transporter [Flavobacteriales bacterium]NQZ37504.1 DMT family transporter [Crocinitomicaceae bacterium]